MFHSDRPGGLGAADLYESTRATTADAWSAPVRLGEPNTTFTEQHPWVSACGLVMTFHSNRLGGTDLFESSRTSVMDAFAMTRALSELNTTNFDKDLRVSPDLRRAMFASDRTGNMDIYETTR